MGLEQDAKQCTTNQSANGTDTFHLFIDRLLHKSFLLISYKMGSMKNKGKMTFPNDEN